MKSFIHCCQPMIIKYLYLLSDKDIPSTCIGPWQSLHSAKSASSHHLHKSNARLLVLPHTQLALYSASSTRPSFYQFYSTIHLTLVPTVSSSIRLAWEMMIGSYRVSLRLLAPQQYPMPPYSILSEGLPHDKCIQPRLLPPALIEIVDAITISGRRCSRRQE